MTQSTRQRWWAWGFLAYAIGIGGFILYWNARSGGLVQNWYAEYVGQDGVLTGSGKWRTEEGRAFQNTALLLGTWVYPFSLIAAGLFLKLAVEDSGVARKLLCLGSAGVALYVLYRFLELGLFTAVTSF
jgi:hypothetical protein